LVEPHEKAGTAIRRYTSSGKASGHFSLAIFSGQETHGGILEGLADFSTLAQPSSTHTYHDAFIHLLAA
jgi:hypothetical protein